MAVRPLSHTSAQSADVAIWSSLATGDTGAPFSPDGDRALAGAVQVEGTFGGATVTLQVSNDGTTYYALKDVTGTSIALTAAGLVEFSTAALYVRPSVSGGAGSALIVTLCARG